MLSYRSSRLRHSPTPDVRALGAYNALSVLELVRVLGPISRADLARQTSFKSAALTGLVRYLIEEGLLVEAEEQKEEAKAGRPARLLRVNAASRQILGIDLEPHYLRLAVTDLGGAILNYRQTTVDRMREPSRIFSLIESLTREMGVRPGSIVGVGASCAGLLDEENGVLLGSTNLPKWRNVPVRALLEKLFGVPVQVGRSIHQAAWAEHWFRDETAPGRMLMVTLRTGLGFSLIDNGAVYQGRDHYDGELGHTTIDRNGPVCECGRRGCLEGFVSPAWITREIRKRGKDDSSGSLAPLLSGRSEVDPEVIYRMARDGHAICREIVDDLVGHLAIGIGNLVNLLNPDSVILCGTIEVMNEELLVALKRELKRQCLPHSWQRLDIRLSRHAERSALLGAAMRSAQFYVNSVVQHHTPA